jgi:hypothetical protein
LFSRASPPSRCSSGWRVPAGATDAFPTTNDQSTTIATARWWYYGQTASQVTALLSANKARLISIDPYQTSAGLRFAVVMVPNSGDQARS